MTSTTGDATSQPQWQYRTLPMPHQRSLPEPKINPSIGDCHERGNASYALPREIGFGWRFDDAFKHRFQGVIGRCHVRV